MLICHLAKMTVETSKHIFELEPGTLFSTELIIWMGHSLEASRVFGTLEGFGNGFSMGPGAGTKKGLN